MILDSHTHVDVRPARLTDGPGDLLAALDRCGVDAAVCTTYAELRDAREVDAYAATVGPHDRLLPLARLDPRDPSAVDLLVRAVQEAGMVGLKLHPVATGVAFDDPRSLRLVRRAGDLGVPTLVHAGPQEVCRPQRVRAGALHCPDAVVVLGHLGGPACAEAAIDAARDVENLVLETSTIHDPRIVARAVAVVADRVVFGSDGPRGSIAAARAVVERADLAPRTRAGVMGGTMLDLLGTTESRPFAGASADAASQRTGSTWREPSPLPGEWDLTASDLAATTTVRGVPDAATLAGPGPIVVTGPGGDVSGIEVEALAGLVRRRRDVQVLSAGWYRADLLADLAASGRLLYSSGLSGTGDPAVERSRVLALDLEPGRLAQVAGGTARRLLS